MLFYEHGILLIIFLTRQRTFEIIAVAAVELRRHCCRGGGEAS
jgi:hypothetical protein